MTFVDELNVKEREPIKISPAPPSKEEMAMQKRKRYITTGDLAHEIVLKLKKGILDDLEASKLFNLPMEKTHTVRCIYQEKEYRKKEKEYRAKYYHSDDVTAKKVVRQQAYLDYYLPHCVFDLDEVKHLESQLRKVLIAEGFQISFEIKEFSFKLCNGLGLGIKKKTYGYTVSFTVHW